MKDQAKDRIVIVDEHDRVLGTEDKEKCHDGEGILHRAFLAMVFTGSGELILTRRSDRKRLWPGFWDGSVASHLFAGEGYVQASRRRLCEELGVEAGDPEYAFKFRYQAGYGTAGTEREICAVTMVRGIGLAALKPDRNEISDIRSMDLKTLIEEVRRDDRAYTPWLLLALEHISERPIMSGKESVMTGASSC